MPIIFASSLLMIPGMLLGGLASYAGSESLLFKPLNYIGLTLNDQASFIFNLLYVVLIFFFCYFWTAITFNPEGNVGQPA